MDIGRWSKKCPCLSTWGGWLVKKGQNFDHVVCEWPHILKSFGILWNLLGSFGIFWNCLESFGIFQNLLESLRFRALGNFYELRCPKNVSNWLRICLGYDQIGSFDELFVLLSVLFLSVLDTYGFKNILSLFSASREGWKLVLYFVYSFWSMI